MTWLRAYDLSVFRSRHGTRWRLWDLAVGIVAFSIAFLLTPHDSIMPQPYYIFVVGCMYGAMLTVFSRVCGVPSPGQRTSSYEVVTAGALAVTLTYLLFSIIVGLVLLKAYGRWIVVITTGFSFIGIILPRLLLMNILRLQPINVVIYGAGTTGRDLAGRLAADPHFQVVGFLDNNPEYHDKERHGYPVFGSIHTFGRDELKKTGADIVVISIVARKLLEENADAILALPLAGIEVLNQGAFLEYYFKEISVEYGCPQWFASAPSVPGNPSIFAAKRLMDFVAACIGLLLTVPLWPFIAAAIRIDSKGPVFFTQPRVGKNGRLFSILKFRTMVQDAEKDGAQWAVQQDPRVTRVGLLLRRTRLDEIPQFWNVLKGEMSLVGPRPERPEFVKELAKEIPYYEQRHLVPPGLTGWAQVRYRYGSSKEDAVRKLQYELYYVRHLSIMFDIEILLRTIPLMAKGSR